MLGKKKLLRVDLNGEACVLPVQMKNLMYFGIAFGICFVQITKNKMSNESPLEQMEPIGVGRSVLKQKLIQIAQLILRLICFISCKKLHKHSQMKTPKSVIKQSI